MTIKRVTTQADFDKVAAMAKMNSSREYDCTVDNFIMVLAAIHKKPWVRLWIAVEGDEAVGYLWASADTSTLYDTVYVGDLFVKEQYRNIRVARDLINALCEWSYKHLKVKSIRYHSPVGERAWNRILKRLKHPVTVKAVNFFSAEGAKEWAE